MTQPYDVPLFAEPPREYKEKRPAPKSVAQAVCSAHVDPDHRRVGLVRQGDHLYWKRHKVRSARGTRLRFCFASDAPLHTCSAKHVPGYDTPTCPCESRKT